MTTPVFTVSPSAYMRELAFVWLGRWWGVLALPLAAATVWSFYDLRAVYIGLIMIFMVYPMVMSLVWFGYAFSPAALRAIAPKHLVLTPEAITVEYDEGEGRNTIHEPIRINVSDIRSVEIHKRHYTIVYDKSPECRLLIPSDVLDDGMKRTLQAYPQAEADIADAF